MNRQIALFGDSIAEGLGVRSKRYAEVVAAERNLELVDYSRTGWTVRHSLEAFRQRPSLPAYAIIAHGVTEPIIRPKLDRLPLPPRWRRVGWMDPRPYYSRRWRRRILERAESAVRWRVKNLLIRRRGGYQFMALDEYRSDLSSLIELLEETGCQVFILGAPPLDHRYFPGSDAQSVRYGAAARHLSGATFIEVRDKLDVWDDFFEDRFHPNLNGHARLAELIMDALDGAT